MLLAVTTAVTCCSDRADCMAKAQDGFTPLHFCSQAGCAEGCRLLLGAKAAVDAKLHKTKKVRLKVFLPVVFTAWQARVTTNWIFGDELM